MEIEDIKALIDDLLGSSPHKGDRVTAKHAIHLLAEAEVQLAKTHEYVAKLEDGIQAQLEQIKAILK